MDMESIRKRRARLDAITSSTRLPTLTPLEVFGARPSSVHSLSSPNSMSSEKRRQQHRHRPDMYLTRKNSASLARAGSGRNTMPALGIPPMTCGRPLHDPLPEIGQTKEDEEADGEYEEKIEENLQEKREEQDNDQVAEEVEEELEGEIEEAARKSEEDSQSQSLQQGSHKNSHWMNAIQGLSQAGHGVSLEASQDAGQEESQGANQEASLWINQEASQEASQGASLEASQDKGLWMSQEANQEASQEANQEASQGASQWLFQGASQEASQEGSQEASQEESQEDSQVKPPEETHESPSATSHTTDSPSHPNPASLHHGPDKRTATGDESSSAYEQENQVLEGEDDAEKLVSDMGSEDINTKLEATVRARKILSLSPNPKIDEFLAADILTPALANLKEEHATLLFETAWVLTNIAAGTSTHTQALVDRGFIQPLVQLLGTTNIGVAEQVTWALSNIAADNPQHRNQMVAEGVVKLLLAHLNQSIPITFMRNIAWALCNLFRRKPLEMLTEEKELILQALKDHLLDHSDSKVQADALQTVSLITDMGNEHIQLVVEAGMVAQLVAFLGTPDDQLLLTALRAVGNLITGTDIQTEAVLDAGVLPLYSQVLAASSSTKAKKEALWAISNILAGTTSQVQQVIDAGLVPQLLLGVQSEERALRKEASWGVFNLTDVGTQEQLAVLLPGEAVPPLLALVEDPEPALATLGVEAILNLLRKSSDPEAARSAVEDHGGLSVLQRSLQHENNKLVNTSKTILEGYFSVDLQEEEEPQASEDEQVNETENNQVNEGKEDANEEIEKAEEETKLEESW